MVKPVPPSIPAECEEESTRNFEITLQSVNIRNFDESSAELSTVESSDIEEKPDLPAVDDEPPMSAQDEELEGAVGYSPRFQNNSHNEASETDSISTWHQDIRESHNEHSFQGDHRELHRRNSRTRNGLLTNQNQAASTRIIQNTHIRENQTSGSDSINEGVTLYQQFLCQQFRSRQLEEPPCLISAIRNTNRSTSASDVMRAGNQLEAMTDKFAKSPMRLWVQQQADNVPLQNLSFNSFSDILYGLFQEGGVTWERVVVLFFFCADLSIRAFREKLQIQFQQLLEWSFKFISGESFTHWVETHGGWTKVLQNSVDQMYKLAMIGFCTMGMLAFAVYIWKTR